MVAATSVSPAAVDPDHGAPPPSVGDAVRLFVSYSRRDAAFARRLAAQLTGGGYAVWLDVDDILPAEEWLAAIRAAIDAADAVVFVVSPDSVDPASVCIHELEHAVVRHKRIVPALRPARTGDPLLGWAVAGADAGPGKTIEFAADGRSLVFDAGTPARRVVALPADALTGFLGAASAPATAAGRTARFVTALDGDKALLKARATNGATQRTVSSLVPEPGESVVAAAVDSSGDVWIAASATGVRIGSGRAGESGRALLPSGFGAITAIAISPDGAVAAVACADRLQTAATEANLPPQRIVLLDTGTGRPMGSAFQLADPAIVLQMVFDPTGQLLASVSQSATSVWVASPALWAARSCARLGTTVQPAASRPQPAVTRCG